MPYMKSLPAKANVREVFGLKPELRRAQGEMGRIIMRGPSALTPAERETIAAYVSHLNRCDYCYGGHSEVAKNLGADPAIFENICDDAETLPVDEKLKPILRFAKVLTLEPRRVSQAHADAVYAAGWDEQALHDAILVICRFAFMNRLTLGHGLDPDPENFEKRGASMAYNSERA
ncbi:MAG: hypothetical protein RL477_1189 [Pseudomonadota bacterium]